MEFDSPDVAKEFPGLYMGEIAGKTLTDPAVYEEDDKGKKKKDKKDKKDKGYATLAGESSHEEDDLLDPKSPGKTKKIKASFKLSAKKKDKKSVDKPDKEKERRHSSSDKKSVEKEKKPDKKKKSLTGEKDILAGTTSPNPPVEKEKGLNLNMALNAFKNAPAPLVKKDKDVKDKLKDKDLKKEKEPSTSSKVKLKLKRSKNSLEDSHQSSLSSDIPITVSHQFPEETTAIVKEIKKYETLLEQTHSHMKSSKKVSKKSEEQLWELQRTLTQLKRKLRSINALSVGSVTAITSTSTAAVANTNHSASKDSTVQTTSVPAALLPKSSDSQQNPSLAKTPSAKDGGEERSKEVTNFSATKVEIVPAPTSIVNKPEVYNDEDMKIDFTLRTAIFPLSNNVPVQASVDSNSSLSQIVSKQDEIKPNNENVTCVSNNHIETFPSSTLPHTLRDADGETPVVVNSNNGKSQRRSSTLNSASITTPELAEIERVQVEVQVHTQKQSPSSVDNTPSFYQDNNIVGVTTPELQLDSTQLSSIIKTLTFSDEEDDDNDEVTDVSCLSLVRNSYHENGIISSADDVAYDGLPRVAAKNEMDHDPFEMAIFETEDYLPIENEALIYFNEELQEEISKEEQDIENLMEQLIQMKNDGVDIDAPEIDLDLDQFDSDELVSLWQITKLENEALNEHVNHLRRMVAVAKLEDFRLETRLKYLEDLQLQRSCVNPVAVAINSANSEENGANN